MKAFTKEAEKLLNEKHLLSAISCGTYATSVIDSNPTLHCIAEKALIFGWSLKDAVEEAVSLRKNNASIEEIEQDKRAMAHLVEMLRKLASGLEKSCV